MSLYDYRVGQEIESQGYPFYALIQAAMRQADTDNLQKLREAFPNTHKELLARYNAPGGLMKGDPEWFTPGKNDVIITDEDGEV